MSILYKNVHVKPAVQRERTRERPTIEARLRQFSVVSGPRERRWHDLASLRALEAFVRKVLEHPVVVHLHLGCVAVALRR